MNTVSVQTRRVYHFEREYLVPDVFLNKQRSLYMINGAAMNICNRYRCKCPVVVFGDGLKVKGNRVSFCQENRIVLALGERDYLTLLHEFAHYLTPEDNAHGYAFMREYFNLLAWFSMYELEELEFYAHAAGIDI